MLLIVFFLAMNGHAAVINIDNPSFEDPPTGHLNGALPTGWSVEGADFGTEWGPSDGLQCMFSGSGQGAGTTIYQTTGHIIAEGDEYQLKFDAKMTWVSAIWPASYEGGLYYDDGGTRASLATAGGSFAAGGWGDGESYSWIEYTVDYTVGAGDPAIGKNLGFSYVNTSNIAEDWGSWAGVDNVRLEFIPEPCSLALFALGTLTLLRRKRT